MTDHNPKHLLVYASRTGDCRVKVITRMAPMHLDAYAQYRTSLIHNGGKPHHDR